MPNSLDSRVFRGAAYVAASAVMGWCWQPYFHGNSEALATIVTVFSILAGFLIAIISIVGDSALIGRGTWRRDHYVIEAIKRRLIRHKLTFHLYLLVLSLAFVIQLLDIPAAALVWFERATLSVAIFAFLVSFSLPDQLLKEQIRKLEQKAATPAQASNRSAQAEDRE